MDEKTLVIVDITGYPPLLNGSEWSTPRTASRVSSAFCWISTKSPGQGTGLGLDISYNIVASNTRGEGEGERSK